MKYILGFSSPIGREHFSTLTPPLETPASTFRRLVEIIVVHTNETKLAFVQKLIIIEMSFF